MKLSIDIDCQKISETYCVARQFGEHMKNNGWRMHNNEPTFLRHFSNNKIGTHQTEWHTLK